MAHILIFLLVISFSNSFASDIFEEDKRDTITASSYGLTLSEFREQRSIQATYFSDSPVVKNVNEVDELEEVMALSLNMTLEEYRKYATSQNPLQSLTQQENEDAALARKLAAEEYYIAAEEKNKKLAQEFIAREESERLAFKLVVEEQDEILAQQWAAQHLGEEENNKIKDEESSDAHIARLLQEEAYPSQQNPYFNANSLKEKICALSYEYSLKPGPEQEILKKFMGIIEHLKGIPQDSDVHILDNYVFGSSKTISQLLEVGRLYNVDQGDLTLNHVGQQMVKFVEGNKDFFAGYKYESSVLTSEQVIAIINSYFPSMDNEVSGTCPEAREVWSRAWTLALGLYQNDGDASAIQIIFDQAMEGPSTQGGCTPGWIDRAFVGYVSLLGKAGVKLHS